MFCFHGTITEVVPVMAVAVTLGFPAMDMSGDWQKQAQMEQVVRDQVSQILTSLSAQTMEPALQVRAKNDRTTLQFTLVGDNKVDVASQLEDMVSLKKI